MGLVLKADMIASHFPVVVMRSQDEIRYILGQTHKRSVFIDCSIDIELLQDSQQASRHATTLKRLSETQINITNQNALFWLMFPFAAFIVFLVTYGSIAIWIDFDRRAKRPSL